MNTIFIIGAKYLFVLPILIALYYFWKSPERKKIFRLSVWTLPIALVVAKIANHLYYNPRPFVSEGITPLISHAADNGFPSDHVLLVSAIASVFMFVDKKAATWLWLITLFVAISRVYVGVHHTLDVVTSMAISVIVGTMVYSFNKNSKNQQNAAGN